MGFQDAIGDSDVIDGLSIRFLKLIGIWNAINSYRTTGKKASVPKIHLIGSLLITIPYFLCQVQSFFNIEFDIQKVTTLYVHPLPAASLCCKILIFWYRMEIICRLYNLIRNDFFIIPHEIRAGVKRIYKKISRMTNIWCMTTFLWVAGAEILYSLFPAMSVDYIQHHTGSMAAVKTGRKKIFGGWYPVPMSDFPYYEIIFVYELICLFWVATLMAVYSCLFFQILMCLYAQYVVLGLRLSSLKLVPPENCRRKRNRHKKNYNTRIYEELCEILLEHQNILKYTDELRSVYNPMVTITLGLGIIALIITALQLWLGSDPSVVFQIAQVFSFVFIEVSMFCLGSSLIGTVSSDLDFAIYSSEWYVADVKFRKAAQMLMVRSRRNANLTALRMYPVNLETLEAILQFTYSATALAIGNI